MRVLILAPSSWNMPWPTGQDHFEGLAGISRVMPFYFISRASRKNRKQTLNQHLEELSKGFTERTCPEVLFQDVCVYSSKPAGTTPDRCPAPTPTRVEHASIHTCHPFGVKKITPPPQHPHPLRGVLARPRRWVLR